MYFAGQAVSPDAFSDAFSRAEICIPGSRGCNCNGTHKLMALVAFTGREASNWKGDLVLYVTDNDNVRSWLTKRRPRNPFARLMICLVQRLEAEHNFTCHSVYIRTYHNEMADWISRPQLGR